MASVTLRNVVKQFGNVKAVDDVNLDIADKEFLVLVGPSGCGKSTTLRMVAGLEDISGGEVYIGDRLVNDVAPKDRDIAMVFQNYALYPHMNVYENMAFSLKLRKEPRAEIDRRVQEAASILGLTDLLKRKPGQLSGGQRQRVALGRAIVREPQVFLMDEPLSNLDAKLRVQMRAELAKLHSRLQTTVIYVTHDQTEAMTMGDRIAVMKDGMVQQVADPNTIYHHPANRFVASFIGSPAMNFLTCRVAEVGGVLRLQGPDLDLRVPDSKADALRGHLDRDIVLGLRPEAVHINPEAVEWLSESTVPALVEVVEPMGAETFLYVSVAGESMTARVSPETRAKAGDKLTLALDLEKMHAFDPETEITLTV